MFTLDGKEYDEKKLEGGAKIAYNNVSVLATKKQELLHKLEQNQILYKHYSEVLKNSLPKEDKK